MLTRSFSGVHAGGPLLSVINGGFKIRGDILQLRNLETASQETLLEAHESIRRILAEADARADEHNPIRGSSAWREQSDAIIKVMLARSIPFVPMTWTQGTRHF